MAKAGRLLLALLLAVLLLAVLLLTVLLLTVLATGCPGYWLGAGACSWLSRSTVSAPDFAPDLSAPGLLLISGWEPEKGVCSRLAGGWLGAGEGCLLPVVCSRLGLVVGSRGWLGAGGWEQGVCSWFCLLLVCAPGLSAGSLLVSLAGWPSRWLAGGVRVRPEISLLFPRIRARFYRSNSMRLMEAFGRQIALFVAAGCAVGGQFPIASPALCLPGWQ